MVHVDTARADMGAWSGVYQRTEETLANPDDGYPYDDRQGLVYERRT